MKTQNEIDAGAVASDLLAISKLKDYLNNIITSILENDAKITDESENMQSITRFCSSQDITLLFLSISSSEQDKGNFAITSHYLFCILKSCFVYSCHYS